MQHSLTDQTNRQLIDLKTGFMATLKNERCVSIKEPVSDTISQIDSELSKRGIHSLKLKTK